MNNPAFAASHHSQPVNRALIGDLAAASGPRAVGSVVQTQDVTAPVLGIDLRRRHGVGPWAEARERTPLTRAEDIAAFAAALSELLKDS